MIKLYVNNKGSMLAVSFIFIFIALLAATLVHQGSIITFREINKEEINYTQGYYAMISGLRYADAVLSHHGWARALGGGVGNTVTLTGRELGGDFYNDIAIPSTRLIITIQVNGGAGTQRSYDVNARYIY